MQPTFGIGRSEVDVEQRRDEPTISRAEKLLEGAAGGDGDDVDEASKVPPHRVAEGRIVVEDEERHAGPIDRYPHPVA